MSTQNTNRLDATAEDLDPDKIYVVGIAVFRPAAELGGDSTPQLLLVQRSAHEAMPNLWEIPGGGVEPAETIREAAFRELKEETGLVATNVLGECEERGWISRRTSKVCEKFTFVVEVEQPIQMVLDPKEHQNWRWLRESEIEGLNFECDERFAQEQREVMRGIFSWCHKNN